MRYVDPSGNIPIDCYGTSYCGSQNSSLLPPAPVYSSPLSPIKPKTGGGGGNGGTTTTPTVIPTTTSTQDPNPSGENPQYSYCGGGDLFYNYMDCGATITQDLALLVDLPFAGVEIIAIGVGCFGGLKGCAAGAALGQELFNLSGGNLVETVLGFSSAGFTYFADGYDDGEIGEATFTSFATVVAGTLSQDPIVDFTIDGYASGYNHDVFNGIYSFFNSEPVIK